MIEFFHLFRFFSREINPPPPPTMEQRWCAELDLMKTPDKDKPAYCKPKPKPRLEPVVR